MKRLVCISLLLLATAIYCPGQNPTPYASVWQLRPSVGYNIAGNLFIGQETDPLLQFHHNALYWQLISASWFFSQRWGIDLIYQGMHSPQIRGRDQKFRDMITGLHQDRYFVTPATGAFFEEVGLISGSFERGTLGIIYRIEHNSLLLYPRLSLGVTSFYTDWGNAYLKEKNTNRVHYLSYSPGSIPNDFLTLGVSALAGVRLSPNWLFHLDLATYWYRARLGYEKSLTDLFTLEKSTETIAYRKNMINLSLGTGLIIVLKNKKDQSSATKAP